MLSVIGFIEQDNWMYSYDWEDRLDPPTVVRESWYSSITRDDFRNRYELRIKDMARWYYHLKYYNRYIA